MVYRYLGFIAIAFLIGTAIVFPALSNMMSLWFTTDTYMHGIFVLPLCWMLYKQQNKIVAAPPSHIVMLLACFVWLSSVAIAKLSLFNVFQQAAFLLFFPFLIFCLFGAKGVWHHRLPLALLFLCIPFGDSFVPYLQSITADMSVWLLQLSGVSVWRQGWYLSIPNADFRVAEACSGVNFLISTFVLAVFFSFMEMEKTYKRIIFSFLGVIVPIIANGVRVYLIIMIADMGFVEAATGFDHLFYGWMFFFVILIILATIGWRWRDHMSVKEKSIVASPSTFPVITLPKTVVMTVAITIFGFGAITWSSLPGAENKDFMWRGTALNPDFPMADSYCYTKSANSENHSIVFEYENEKKKVLSIDNRIFGTANWTIEKRHGVKEHDGELATKFTLKDLAGNEKELYVQYIVGGNIYTSAIKLQLALWYDRIMKDVKPITVNLFLRDAGNISSDKTAILNQRCQS